ncbi:hypothetical protein GOBAR_DD18874 [Gossypium barbadense]|nr:hypothetical protein GOBAR_DD18874 [Gossypium barbadense]
MATQEDDEDYINPPEMILPDEEDEGKSLTMLGDGAVTQQRCIRSIESTVVIRQLPSEGISFQLWPAATTLVTLLENHRRYPNKNLLTDLSTSGGNDDRKLKILELGSGTGLVGISAAVMFGANVTVTDLPQVVPNLQFNVEANADVVARKGGTVNVAPLRGGEDDDVKVIGREFDIVLASDVVYHAHLFEPLIETLRFLLNGCEKMAFIMATLEKVEKGICIFQESEQVF